MRTVVGVDVATGVSVSREVVCTGIAAQWCPVCGTCTCPRDDSGEIEWHWQAGYIAYAGFLCWSGTALHVSHFELRCPLHGAWSPHATGEVEP